MFIEGNITCDQDIAVVGSQLAAEETALDGDEGMARTEEHHELFWHCDRLVRRRHRLDPSVELVTSSQRPRKKGSQQ